MSIKRIKIEMFIYFLFGVLAFVFGLVLVIHHERKIGELLISSAVVSKLRGLYHLYLYNKMIQSQTQANSLRS
jgi:hypothetical protein